MDFDNSLQWIDYHFVSVIELSKGITLFLGFL